MPEPDAEPDAGVQLGMVLPAGWETRESRSTGDAYFVNVVTQEATYDPPQHAVLPPGWTHAISSSTGEVYYIDPEGASTYDPPPGAGALHELRSEEEPEPEPEPELEPEPEAEARDSLP